MSMTIPHQTQAVVENRRRQLQRWINARFAGMQTQFVASTNDGEKQLNQGELSGLLRKKSFGEKRARALETQAHMPSGYLDSQTDPMDVTPREFAVREDRGTYAVLPSNAHSWPFPSVTQKRLQDLISALDKKRGDEAIDDIDRTLEIVVLKWEREIAQRKSAVG